MSDMNILPQRSFAHDFVPAEFRRDGDEHELRNQQVGLPADHWRDLTAEEIDVLVKNGNTAEDWSLLRVAEGFNARHVKHCEFYGLVRLGRIGDVSLEYHDLAVPVGLTHSRIVACDIGDDTAVHNVRYLAHTIVGDNCMLLNIDELHTTNHAKFGNGIVKDGEDPAVRVWLDVGNEAGGRSIAPFDGMIPADAALWSRFPGDRALVETLAEITQRQFDSRRGYYATIGPQTVIKNCRIIKDVKIGPAAYIKGANKLKNLTINSTPESPTQIGEGVELVNGIISEGCKVFYGCKAVRFVMCANSNLKYGARLIHSVLGENSTVSCCEMLNNLIFPAHEQHHNNSFLIASTVLGQSNIAAAATIGSNHNSRAPEGEILAGRGFWPGLCTSLKHNCRFASFTLLAKGDYPAELNIPLPFSLLSNDVAADRLLVMPAYWWMYNLYALARNGWKFRARDKRKAKVQNIEFDYLAPDTAEEIVTALSLLELWTGKAALAANGKDATGLGKDEIRAIGRELLQDDPAAADRLDVRGENMEAGRRDVCILKAGKAWGAYRDMLHYYGAVNCFDWLDANPNASLADMHAALTGPRVTDWFNLGGQLVPMADLDQLRADIRDGKLPDWNAVHAAYDELWQAYPLARQRHAYAVLCELAAESSNDQSSPSPPSQEMASPRASGGSLENIWPAIVDKAIAVQQYICDQTRNSRAKDYENPFRRMTYSSDADMQAVLGTVEDNSFIQQIREETQAFATRAQRLRERS
jgi:hypothetical protein